MNENVNRNGPAPKGKTPFARPNNHQNEPMKNPIIQPSCRRCAKGALRGALLLPALLLQVTGLAQVNTGSNGSDGPFNPTANTVINMATHPDGIYQYTSVNIPANVTVTFIPNANNTPVVWLVQNNVVINGTVSVSGQSPLSYSAAGAAGGPGGYRGGNAAAQPGGGLGPGGGPPGGSDGESAAFGATPTRQPSGTTGWVPVANGTQVYGNQYLLPLLGGSGGGGAAAATGPYYGAGGGGGGAILIAASGQISIGGSITANGGGGGYYPGSDWPSGGAGSGGAVRLVASSLRGTGSVDCLGAWGGDGEMSGLGRVRLDVLDDNFGGQIGAVVTRGFQPIIIPSAGHLPQLTITSIAGVPVSAPPTGVLSTPDAVLSAQQNNPIPIVVQCSNLPLGTPITVSVKPMNGSPVSAVGYNAGTLGSSTATVSLNIPRGGGLIYATAGTGN